MELIEDFAEDRHFTSKGLYLLSRIFVFAGNGDDGLRDFSRCVYEAHNCGCFTNTSYVEVEGSGPLNLTHLKS